MMWSLKQYQYAFWIPVDRYTFTIRIFSIMKSTAIKGFHAVEFFRDVKEKMAKATEGMSLQERRIFFQQMREGKINLA
jgi:hypothetical protein